MAYPQSAFSIDIRDFSGFGGTETISVYGTDLTTLLNTYDIALSGTIITFANPGESAAIGSVSFSNISNEGWTGILQSATFNSTPVPEPTSILLLSTGLGVLGLIAFRRKRK